MEGGLLLLVALLGQTASLQKASGQTVMRPPIATRSLQEAAGQTQEAAGQTQEAAGQTQEAGADGERADGELGPSGGPAERRC